MSRVFLIRHGEPETGWGAGHDDPGLSQRGRAQAEAAATALQALAPARIVTSPLRRCVETAAPFAALSGLTPLVDAAFGEVRTPSGIADRRAWLVENFPWGAGAPSRSWTEASADLCAWRQLVIDAASALQGDVAVFTHFIATNVIVGAALGKRETIVCRPGFASITELSADNGVLSVVRLGEEMNTGDVR